MQLHQVFCPDVRCTIPLKGYPSIPLEKEFIKINVQRLIDDIQFRSQREKIINEKIINEKIINEKIINEKIINEKIVNEKIINEKMINRYLKAKNDTNK